MTLESWEKLMTKSYNEDSDPTMGGVKESSLLTSSDAGPGYRVKDWLGGGPLAVRVTVIVFTRSHKMKLRMEYGFRSPGSTISPEKEALPKCSPRLHRSQQVRTRGQSSLLLLC